MQIRVDDITLPGPQGPLFAHTSWAYRSGQHWAILGPNAAGKSRLAQVIARGTGLLHGQIQYFMQDDAPAESRPYVYPHEIVVYSNESHRAFLRQFSAYHQARWHSFEGQQAPTVAALLNEISAAPADRQRVDHLLDIAALRERRVHQLSHGESRKVFLASLLLRAPRMIILDDPFTGLDDAARVRLRAALEALLGEDAPAVLLVTSRTEDILAGITHLLLVRDGHVIAQGERHTISTLPAYRQMTAKKAVLPASHRITDPLESSARQYAAHLAQAGVVAGQELIHLEQVNIRYGEQTVLNEINWHVLQGERWALTGPNGAGKSTLLSLILADHPQAYRNKLRLFGRPRGSGESIWEIKRRIGWVAPELQIFYEQPLNCFEAVCSGLFDSVGLYRQPNAAQHALAAGWMQAFGLAALAERPFQSLSTGQQRLVLLARAVVKQPPLLILDEPCQGLDAPQRAAFLAFLDALCRLTPVSLIYVSHDPQELPAATTHHLRLAAGQSSQSPR